MDVPARLKWRRELDRYAAYPTATEPNDRFAAVKLIRDGYDGGRVELVQVRTWHWHVRWEGWFQESGIGSSKQEAADRATAAWWRNIQTDIPRDVEFEAAMIAARALVQPPPNSLFAEDAEFLRKVLWHVHNVYSAEIAAGLPGVKNLYDQISQELYRRRISGETSEPGTGSKAS